MNISNQTYGIILGGFVPAILYGLSAITMKAGTGYKMSTSSYLMIIGVVVFCVGFMAKPFLDAEQTSFNLPGIGFSILSGFCWVLGTALVNYSVIKFNSPIAILTPLYNMNTLVAVLGGMILFAEWKTVHSMPVFIGTALVICGGVLLSKA